MWLLMTALAAGYWAVDAKEETAMNGTWKKGPGTELFAALERVGPPGCLPAFMRTHQAPQDVVIL